MQILARIWRAETESGVRVAIPLVTSQMSEEQHIKPCHIKHISLKL